MFFYEKTDGLNGDCFASCKYSTGTSLVLHMMGTFLLGRTSLLH